MTISDFLQYTEQFNQTHPVQYQVNLPESVNNPTANYQIMNDHHQQVAIIDTQQQSNYQLTNEINAEYLIRGIAHFANTPIDMREATTTVRVYLSQYDIEQLASIQSYNTTAKKLTLTNAQLHALRHFRRQFYQPDKIE